MAAGKKTKRWALIGGGLALFGAGAAASTSGAWKGFTDSLAKLKPAVKSVADTWLPGLGKVAAGERPVNDYLPNTAAVQEAFERLYGSTAGGAAEVAEGRAQALGGLLLNPITWIVAAVGLFFLLRRR
jgi:hypothetical protein